MVGVWWIMRPQIRLLMDLGFGLEFYSSDNALVGVLLAMANVLVAALTRICDRVRFAVSSAKSVSRIVLSAAVTFSNATFNELIVDPTTTDWNEPMRARALEI